MLQKGKKKKKNGQKFLPLGTGRQIKCMASSELIIKMYSHDLPNKIQIIVNFQNFSGNSCSAALQVQDSNQQLSSSLIN